MEERYSFEEIFDAISTLTQKNLSIKSEVGGLYAIGCKFNSQQRKFLSINDKHNVFKSGWDQVYKSEELAFIFEEVFRWYERYCEILKTAENRYFVCGLNMEGDYAIDSTVTVPLERKHRKILARRSRILFYDITDNGDIRLLGIAQVITNVRSLNPIQARIIYVFGRPMRLKYMIILWESLKSSVWKDNIVGEIFEIPAEMYEWILEIEADSDTMFDSSVRLLQNPLHNFRLNEGKKSQRWVTTYERSPVYRNQALAIHGYSCHVCGFDFEDFYGELGKDYIQVHHIYPVSKLGKKVVDPRTDLIPICANCHSIIHRNKNHPTSIDALRKAVAASKKRRTS